MQNEPLQMFTVFKNHSKIIAVVSLTKIIDVIVKSTSKTQVENVRRLLSEGRSDEAQQTKKSLNPPIVN